MPDVGNQLGFLLITALDKFPGRVVPEILYDGITDPMKVDPPKNPMRLCVKQPGAHLANLHFEKLDVNKPDLASIVVVDPPDYDCALPATPPVSFPGVEAK